MPIVTESDPNEAPTPAPPTPEEAIRARLLDLDSALYRDFIDPIRRGSDAVASIVLYGSMLSDQTKAPTSVPDFFVVVDDYAAYLPRLRDRVLARILPPNVYRLTVDGDTGPRPCKVCVVSEHDLFACTSPDAKDFYIAGRFSKRMGLVYSRDAEATETLVSAIRAAGEALVPHAVAMCPAEFSLDQFCLEFLTVSYRGEVRPEGDEKVRRIFDAEADYYRLLYRLLLTDYVRTHRHDFKRGDPPDRWTFRGTLSERSDVREKTRRRIARSRRRSVLRWPKQIYLFDDWLEFLLDKAERTWGVDLRSQMTERERRHPLLFGWKHFFRLRRQGKIR